MDVKVSSTIECDNEKSLVKDKEEIKIKRSFNLLNVFPYLLQGNINYVL